VSDSTAPEKHSPLHDVHRDAGASFTDFAGWMMPVRYSSDLAEHHAVRTAAGLFDISHMAEITVTGPDAAAFLDFALAANVSALALSKAKYTMILDEAGGILDDLIVYATAPGVYLVVANAGNREVVVSALADRVGEFDVQVDDDTESIALIAVQGPKARAILAATAGLEEDPELALGHTLDELPYYACLGARFEGAEILLARTGYTGEDGFELYVPVSLATALWTALLTAGEPLGLVPCGLAARDTLRLEAGMPLYGHELGRDILPVQAGLGRVVPLKTKTVDFVGRAAIEAGPVEGARVLVGLIAEGKRAGRADYPLFVGDREVGVITSGALSPTLGHPIAMAFVDPDVSAVGTALDIDVRGSRVAASVVPLPFYKKEDNHG